MALVVSSETEHKLAQRHGVNLSEITECFANRNGCFLIDSREEHKTNPPTEWFIAQTDRGRILKVVFIMIGKDVHIKSAYSPNPIVVKLYERLAQVTVK